jgi:hypothetical protein
MARKIIICSLLASILGVPSQAQEVDTQMWLNYSLTIPLSPKLSYGGDFGYRRDLNIYDWDQFLIRPTVTYRLNKTFRASGALALFQTFNRNTNNISEFRIHQDFNVNWPELEVVRVFSRFRAEQRFFYYQNLPTGLSPNTFNVRLRFLGGAQTRDITFFGEERPIYFKFIFEGFVTLNKEEATEFFINNTRMHFAFGHRLSNSWRYEIHFIRQGSRLLSNDGFKLSQNIFRLRVFHTIFENESDLPEEDELDIE